MENITDKKQSNNHKLNKKDVKSLDINKKNLNDIAQSKSKKEPNIESQMRICKSKLGGIIQEYQNIDK